MWGFPKIRGTFLGVPIIRTIVFWGPYWGPPILGNYHVVPFLVVLVRTLTKKPYQTQKGIMLEGLGRVYTGFRFRLGFKV